MTSYKCTIGTYIQRNYKVWVDCRLEKMPTAQCGVCIKNDFIVLYSYITPVLILNNITRVLWCSGLYSATTRRHISAFLREYCPNITYSTIKAIAATENGIDTRTGELIDCTELYNNWYRGLFAPTYY